MAIRFVLPNPGLCVRLMFPKTRNSFLSRLNSHASARTTGFSYKRSSAVFHRCGKAVGNLSPFWVDAVGGWRHEQFWEQIKERLARKLSADAYQNWISRTELARISERATGGQCSGRDDRGPGSSRNTHFTSAAILKDFQPPGRKNRVHLGNSPLRLRLQGAAATNGATVQPLGRAHV